MKTIKRMAAEVLRVGENKVKIVDQDKALEAVTKDDVRNVISQGAIVTSPMKTNSRGRARAKRERRAKRSTGQGRRKGTANARFSGKDRWIIKVRAQRKYLKELEKKKKLSPTLTRKLYLMVKGNYFRSKKHMEEYVSGLKTNV
jgi:large subunit ribosomal protein L19e